jgi:hypothetical protein
MLFIYLMPRQTIEQHMRIKTPLDHKEQVLTLNPMAGTHSHMCLGLLFREGGYRYEFAFLMETPICGLEGYFPLIREIWFNAPGQWMESKA